MDLFAEVKGRVLAAVERLASEGRLPEGLDLSGGDGRAAARSRPRRHGDERRHGAGAPGAAGAARDRRGARRRVLAGEAGIVSAEVAGPGFLNLRIDPGRWFGIVPAVLAAGTGFGRSTLGAGRKVNVEFVSANPTGPMHVGHTRGAVFGDALAGLLGFAGWEVTREYYINDGGGAGRRARALGLRALPRGLRARSGDRRGALSRRLPDPGRRGAEGEVRRQPARQGRGGLARRRCGNSPPRR